LTAAVIAGRHDSVRSVDLADLAGDLRLYDPDGTRGGSHHLLSRAAEQQLTRLAACASPHDNQVVVPLVRQLGKLVAGVSEADHLIGGHPFGGRFRHDLIERHGGEILDRFKQVLRILVNQRRSLRGDVECRTERHGPARMQCQIQRFRQRGPRGQPQFLTGDTITLMEIDPDENLPISHCQTLEVSR
jgi:hypothetical protein